MLHCDWPVAFMAELSKVVVKAGCTEEKGEDVTLGGAGSSIK